MRQKILKFVIPGLEVEHTPTAPSTNCIDLLAFTFGDEEVSNPTMKL